MNSRIPNKIRNDNKLILYFLRGLFDTDGCLKFSKQYKSKNYYPRIQFCFRRSKFADDVGEVLRKVDFNFCRWDENRVNGLVFYQLSGKENLERWFNKIKPSNFVHLSKYLFWKRFGYYTPKSSLESRLKALNLNMDDISSAMT